AYLFWASVLSPLQGCGFPALSSSRQTTVSLAPQAPVPWSIPLHRFKVMTLVRGLRHALQRNSSPKNAALSEDPHPRMRKRGFAGSEEERSKEQEFYKKQETCQEQECDLSDAGSHASTCTDLADLASEQSPSRIPPPLNMGQQEGMGQGLETRRAWDDGQGFFAPEKKQVHFC
ncbi:unnamed protein product, partial [Chrysoparadoxa australica]